MSSRKCPGCSKIVSTKVKVCPFCGLKQRANLPISAIMLTTILFGGVGFIGYSILEMQLAKVETNFGSSLNMARDVIVGVAESTKPRSKVTIQPMERGAEETGIQSQIDDTEPSYSDDSLNTASEYNGSYEEDSVKLKERTEHWTKIYRDKYAIPEAGKSLTLRLKNGTSVSGAFMGVVGSSVKLESGNEIKTVSKSKLSTRSRLRMFCSDYVEYFVNKRLKEEGLL